MPTEDPDILTVTEVAALLRVPKSTIYKLAQDRELPAQKVGRHWRFSREAIVRWVQQHADTDSPSKEKSA